MEASPITWGGLLTVLIGALPAALAVLKLVASVRTYEKEMLAAIDAMRLESSAARSKLYERLEEMAKEMANIYVRRDVHAAERQHLLHTIDELNQTLSFIREERDVTMAKKIGGKSD